MIIERKEKQYGLPRTFRLDSKLQQDIVDTSNALNVKQAELVRSILKQGLEQVKQDYFF